MIFWKSASFVFQCSPAHSLGPMERCAIAMIAAGNSGAAFAQIVRSAEGPDEHTALFILLRGFLLYRAERALIEEASVAVADFYTEITRRFPLDNERAWCTSTVDAPESERFVEGQTCATFFLGKRATPANTRMTYANYAYDVIRERFPTHASPVVMLRTLPALHHGRGRVHNYRNFRDPFVRTCNHSTISDTVFSVEEMKDVYTYLQCSDVELAIFLESPLAQVLIEDEEVVQAAIYACCGTDMSATAHDAWMDGGHRLWKDTGVDVCGLVRQFQILNSFNIDDERLNVVVRTFVTMCTWATCHQRAEIRQQVQAAMALDPAVMNMRVGEACIAACTSRTKSACDVPCQQ